MAEKRINTIFFFSPVYNTFGVAEKFVNESGGWATKTVLMNLDWPPRCCMGIMFVQVLSFLWLCSKLRVFVLSAVRNYSLFDLKLLLHVLFPVVSMVFSVVLAECWNETQVIKSWLKCDLTHALSLFKSFHFYFQNVRVVYGVTLFVFLISNLPFNNRSCSKSNNTIFNWVLNNPVIISHKISFTISSLVLTLAVSQLKNLLNYDCGFSSFKLSLPNGLFLFMMSPVLFFVRKNQIKSNATLAMGPNHKNLSILNSLCTILRFYYHRVYSFLLGSIEYGSLSKSNAHVAADACKRYHVPLRLECLMEELEKQVDELMYRTIALTGHLKQSPESPFGTWKSTNTAASNDFFHTVSKQQHRRAHSFDQNQSNYFNFVPCNGGGSINNTPHNHNNNSNNNEGHHKASPFKFSSGEFKSSQSNFGPTLMQLKLLASSSANLDIKSRDNVLECLEELVYNKICGQCEFLFEKEFELELLLDMMVSEDPECIYWNQVHDDVYSSHSLSTRCGAASVLSCNGGANNHNAPRIRSHSAAALVRSSFSEEYESPGEGATAERDTVVTGAAASMRTASSEDKLSVSISKRTDGLVQPIKIVYPSSSYEKSKTVKLHRLCQENVNSLRAAESSGGKLLRGIQLKEMKVMNHHSDDQCLNRKSSKQIAAAASSKIVLEPTRLRNLSSDTGGTKLHRTHALKGGGFFLDT